MIDPAPIIQFSHANGFPAGSYRYFFKCLEPLKVQAIPILGGTQYRASQGWQAVADQLIEEIESRNSSPVIGIGHSFGAVVTLMAAGKRPDLFKKVLILDPPLMRPAKRLMIGTMNMFGLSRFFPPAAKTRKRRTDFPDRKMAREYFKPKWLFRNFHPECYEDYVQYGLTEIPGNGLTLTIPAGVEYACFTSTPTRLPAYPKGVPVHFLLSDSHEVLQKKDILALKRAYPKANFDLFAAGHLFPMEKPKEIADWIKNWIEKN